MTKEEFNSWAMFMKSNVGKWTVDPIHNGVDRDLLCFAGRPDDSTKGIFVSVYTDGSWSVGRYWGACPHIGEAIFEDKSKGKADTMSLAIEHLVNCIGLSFLKGLVRCA